MNALTPQNRHWMGLRWYIGGLLFLSTVINYIDRQTLSVLAPYIKTEFQWSNTDFAMLIIAFRVAYAGGQAISGRFLDHVGTRRGLTVSVTFYSIAAMATSLATGFRSLAFFRFLLGLGESANWPGATKAVSEWFPRKESGWAVALFDSGSSIGGAVAPFLVLSVYHYFGSWRPAFIVTGALGFAWLILFRYLYRSPEDHPRLSPEERQYILDGREETAETPTTTRLSYRTLFRLPQTWGIASLLISRGWSVGWARKIVVLAGGIGMTLLAPTVWVDSFAVLVACFAISTFCYAAVSTMILNLPADVYPSGSVASVSGLSGTGAGIGTITATYLTGAIADSISFAPILIGASIIPLFAVVAVLGLVRNNAATTAGVVKAI